MTTSPGERRLLAFGYVRAGTEDEVVALQAALSSFAAAARGLRLGEVFTDTQNSTRGHGAMISAAQVQQVTVIIVADASPLRAGGIARVRAALNARVMVMPDVDQQTGEVGTGGPSATPHE